MTSVEVQSHTTRPWADIPPDLLLPIAKRLDLTTAIRLSAVRTAWAPTILPCFASIPSFHPNQPIPWLLISIQKSETQPNYTDFTFYDLITATYYSIPTPIPSLNNHQWYCSNKGWLVTVDPQSQLHLIKPLTGAHVLLPSYGIFRARPWKVILCRTPDCTDGYFAIGINNLGNLVIAKAGVDSWISMNNYSEFHDVVLYKGKVYTISLDGFCCWDILGSSLRCQWYISTFDIKRIDWCTKYLEMWRQMWRRSSHFNPWTKYLVEWRGELLLVFTNKESSTRLENYAHCRVILYKFNFKDHDRRLRRVWSLGNDSLFIGANKTYAVSTQGVDNVRGNCVYFTDQIWNYFRLYNKFQSKCAFGVYDLKKQTYNRCYLENENIYRLKYSAFICTFLWYIHFIYLVSICIAYFSFKTNLMTSVEFQNHTTRPWADIPPDLLLRIAKRLDLTTAIRLSAMHTSWPPIILPFFASIPFFHPDQPIPWLLISIKKSETEPNYTDITFYDLITATYYSIPTPIPSLYNHQWYCSNKGWLVTVDPQSQLHLIKPLTGAHVLLPSDGIGIERPWKVILCRTPDCIDGYFAISINNLGNLVVAKAGVDSWISMNNYCKFHDVVLYKGKVYTISFDGFSCWDILGSSLRSEWFISTFTIKRIDWWTKYLETWRQIWRSSRHFYSWTKYLVEWRGGLLLVFTNKESSTRFGHYAHCRVILYKFNFQGRDRRLRRVWSLGNDALFIGANKTYAVSTKGVDNVRGNCIYFTDQIWNYFRQSNKFQTICAFGVYDLKKQTYNRCYMGNSPLYSMPPIWFWPC
ncbi:uncharacterized protein LOC144560207 [Carex rostrata]